jgi:hypothetical protein
MLGPEKKKHQRQQQQQQRAPQLSAGSCAHHHLLNQAAQLLAKRIPERRHELPICLQWAAPAAPSPWATGQHRAVICPYGEVLLVALA